MAPILLFVTGVLAGLIAGFVLARTVFRTHSGDGHAERKLLEERLLKADQGLEKFADELQSQRQEAKSLQLEIVEARENAVESRTQLEAVQRERDQLKSEFVESYAFRGRDAPPHECKPDRSPLSDQRLFLVLSSAFRDRSAVTASPHRGDGRSRPAPGTPRHPAPVA